MIGFVSISCVLNFLLLPHEDKKTPLTNSGKPLNPCSILTLLVYSIHKDPYRRVPHRRLDTRELCTRFKNRTLHFWVVSSANRPSLLLNSSVFHPNCPKIRNKHFGDRLSDYVCKLEVRLVRLFRRKLC